MNNSMVVAHRLLLVVLKKYFVLKFMMMSLKQQLVLPEGLGLLETLVVP